MDAIDPLELRNHRAYWWGERVELTLREFAIVRCLVDRLGAYVTYQQLYNEVRGNGFVAGNVVTYGSDGSRVNVRR